ncbi:MAG TPA: hypothetical protein VNJ70_14755 [Thermoanaerobaculia bacterium]|nr:hypothetical protein [Thermoanaerobaculia bacterium]
MRSSEESTAPPIRAPLDEGNGLRETYAYFLPPEIADALRLLSGYVQDRAFEGERTWDHIAGAVAIAQLRAAAVDLRHVEGFLWMVSEDPDSDERELVRLCRLARRLSGRVAKIAAAIEGALR